MPTKFNQDQRDKILAAHNKVRAEVSKGQAKNADGSRLQKPAIPLEPLVIIFFKKLKIFIIF